ncbi:hypothetical protein MHBO_002288 [Bonamia ostreae]|uniref:Uncharacterized protein n=1 Tax=Bonamia ostreae TaxID=126728 RepID=A0ABV2ALV1_9EUKA
MNYPENFISTVDYDNDTTGILKAISSIKNFIKLDEFETDEKTGLPKLLLLASEDLERPTFSYPSKYGLAITTVQPRASPNSLLPLFHDEKGCKKVPKYILFVAPETDKKITPRNAIYLDSQNKRVEDPISVGEAETKDGAKFFVFYPKFRDILNREALEETRKLVAAIAEDLSAETGSQNYTQKLQNITRGIEQSFDDFVSYFKQLRENSAKLREVFRNNMDWDVCISASEATEFSVPFRKEVERLNRIKDESGFELEKNEELLQKLSKLTMTVKTMDDYIENENRCALAKQSIKHSINESENELLYIMDHCLKADKFESADKAWKCLENNSSFFGQMSGRENNYDGRVELRVRFALELKYSVSGRLFGEMAVGGMKKMDVPKALLAMQN